MSDLKQDASHLMIPVEAARPVAALPIPGRSCLEAHNKEFYFGLGLVARGKGNRSLRSGMGNPERSLGMCTGVMAQVPSSSASHFQFCSK